MIHPFRLPFTLAALLVLINYFRSPSLDAPAGIGEPPLSGISALDAQITSGTSSSLTELDAGSTISGTLTYTARVAASLTSHAFGLISGAARTLWPPCLDSAPFGLALEQFAHLSAAGSCGAPRSQWGGQR